jgi:hypothetical protein
LSASARLPPRQSRRRLPLRPPAPPSAPDRPRPDQYRTHEDYIEAIADWKAAQKIAEAETKRADQARQAEQTRAQQTQASAWEQQMYRARGGTDDYNDVLADAQNRISPARQ